MPEQSKNPEKKKISREEKISRFNSFLDRFYKKELLKSSEGGSPLIMEYSKLEKFDDRLARYLEKRPDSFFEIAEDALKEIDLSNPVKIRVNGMDVTNVRDLRSRNVNKFICVEGIVRRASEIRPEITETSWICPCGELIVQPRKGSYVYKPFECPKCRNKVGIKQAGKKMIDTRWITVEEPFELTEGDRPSQLTVLLTEDLIDQEGRRMTDPGNRIKFYGTLKEIPKGKKYSVKLDFYLDCNHMEMTEGGWKHLIITKKDEKRIKEMAADPEIYEKLVDSFAPSLYGLREIKESVILQLFGGISRTLEDGMRFRGDIHILLVGDPSAGKSQILKLVPTIVPRGRYVSGKGVTGAGLTASVIKDEQFMGGWVLEAGALVLTNRGLLAIDEFEKMSPDDQVAMHEALEQGSVSIAKASIVATLPAQTSVLAGGNPKFSRFDPYMPIAKQITLPETLLSRFDLKFPLRDVPNAEQDKQIVDHILKARSGHKEYVAPVMDSEFIRKYVAYSKRNCMPEMTDEASSMLKKFYVNTRKRAESGGAVPITLRQFESLVRLTEASAKVQLCKKVRKDDARRAIKLMKYSLKQLGFDYETGQIDIDRSDGATTSSERSKIRTFMDIINSLSEKKKEIPVADIGKEAKKQNIDNYDELLEKLKREGMIFEPNPGFIQKV